MKISKLNLGMVFLGLVFSFSLVGCGSDDSRPAAPFVEAQKNLPDSGYWYCRLDYTAHLRDGSTSRDFFATTGEGRGAVKQKITQQCISGAYEVDCSVEVTNDRFRCARAENTGHLNGYSDVTYCRLPFTTVFRGKSEEGAFESTGENQRSAVKKLFNTCLRGFYSRECSDAILSDAMDCKPVQ